MRKYLNSLNNRIQSWGDFKGYFKNRRNRTSLLIVVVLILALPIGIYLLRQQQILKSRANVLYIEYTGANVDRRSDGTWVTKTTSSLVSIKITSPFGLPGTPAPAAAQEAPAQEAPTQEAPAQAPTQEAPAQAPASPANLSASCPTPGTTGSFNWGGVSGATSYNVFISTSGHDYNWSTCGSSNICLGNISGTSYNYPSLIAGTSYQWYVASCNSAGCSNAATGPSFTCEAPATLTSGNLLSSDMQGQTISGTDKYKIQWFTDPGTYHLSGTVSSGDGAIWADDYVVPVKGGDQATAHYTNPSAFTLTSGHQFAVVLFVNSGASATFSGVTLTKDLK